MKTRHSPVREIIAINIVLFGAFCFAFLAWLIWPQNSEWWHAGVLSILFIAVSLGFALQGLRRTVDLFVRDHERRAFLRQGRAPRADGLAGNEVLRERGLL